MLHFMLVVPLKTIPDLKPQLHERFFARAGDAIFSNFVASPARDENRTCSHPRTGDATGEKIARKKSPELKFSRQNRRKSRRVATLQLFARACDATKEYLANEITGRNRDSGFSKNNNGERRQKIRRGRNNLLKCAIRSAFNLSPNSLEFVTRVATLSRWGRDEFWKNRITCASKKSLV